MAVGGNGGYSLKLPHPSNAKPIELLTALVRIPSVNPDIASEESIAGEEPLAMELASWLEAAGAEVSLRQVRPGRPNVVARFPSTRSKPRILFAPHLDTVGVNGMTIDPFAADCRDGKLHGRGASDTKGSMAAMLSAILFSKQKLDTLSHEIWFAGLAGEEVGQIGARALSSTDLFDFVIAGEPTGLSVIHATKGTARLTLRTRGVAAHSCAPSKGVNAITAMLPALLLLEDEISKEFASMNHNELGAPTLNIGLIHGGRGANVVPDDCVAEVNLRTIPGQSLEDLPKRLEAAAPGVEATLRANAAFRTDPSHPLVTLLANAGEGITTAPWYCDAAIFAESGSAAVAAGPGSIDQAHTSDEFIQLEDLDRGVDFFSQFLSRLK